MNIYNFASNEGEWTLEKTSDSYSPCANRGGNYDNTGSIGPASAAISMGLPTADANIGFRPALYAN